MIKQLISKSSNLNILFDAIEDNKHISIVNCGEGEQVSILDEINHPKFFVVSSREEVLKYKTIFESLNRKVNYCDEIPNLLISNYSTGCEKYINFINNLNNTDFDYHIVTPNVALLPVPIDIFDNDKYFSISVDEEIEQETLIRFLTDMGYNKCDTISMPGQFCTRGEIVEFVSKANNVGYRITFDYDTISKLTELDEQYISPEKQIDCIIVSDNKLYNPDIDKINKELGNKHQELKQLLDSYCEFNKDYNCLWFLQYNSTKLISIFDIINNQFVIVFSDTKRVYDECLKCIDEFEEKIREGQESKLLLPSHYNILSLNNITNISKERGCIVFQFINNSNRIFSPNAVFSFKCMPNISYGENYGSLIIDLKNLQKMGYTVVLFLDDDNINQVLSKLTNRISYNLTKSIFNIEHNQINIINKTYNNSFNFYDEKIALIGSNAVGKHYNIVSIKNISNNEIINEIELPQENDFVVHKIHGIGKCLGIQTLELMKEVKKEYIIIEYKGEDKLYLPIENIDSITKYIGDDETPKLNKLGGTEFKKIKDKVKSSVKDIAQDLIKIYKERLDAKGYKYPEDDEIQQDFESKFQHELTSDQQIVLDQVKEEMTQGKLIDRLICGDVGFGKTEIAIRIAFKTILAGKSVAILCPTTVLSEQHFNTFFSRMHDYGINVAVLNRFKTSKEVDEIINNVNNGTINLIIGTHKLLNKEIKFKNLGLLIIDEEQKFGVEHKEIIKNLKKDVNVLTLSATPIPRTLHLSLSGIRDISTIQTPPVTKISTQVSVMEYSDLIVNLAIEKEMQRGGQVLIIYNKVEDIDVVASKIKQLTNNKYVIDIAHGQMTSNVLENKIMRLYNGSTQILVSTTLIENGVDLPNANTLIVLDSDKLGLSQLYQLKGRVGRGTRESYAYFMYRGIISDIAYKRLKAISEYTAMGSGYKISMRDMELRGAGDVFGSQQHGHLSKVGYALYLSILNNAVQELKTNSIDNSLYTELRIETDLDISIPYSSQFTTNQKLTLYSNIANIKDIIQYNNTTKKIINIYGQLPKSLENLCKFALLKNKLAKFGANRLIIKNNIKRIEFDKNIDINTIQPLINNNCALEITNKIFINIKNIQIDKVLDYLISII